MEEKRLILKITIPEYPREVQIAKEARPKYYYWDGTTIKAKGKKLLQKYIDSAFKKHIIKNNGNVRPEHLKDGYIIIGIKGNKVFSVIDKLQGEYRLNPLTKKQMQKETKYVLCEADSNNGEFDIEIDKVSRVIANSTKAGKPRYQIIKGQDMYSGVLNEFTRAKIVNELKQYYYESKFNTLTPQYVKNVRERINTSYPVIVSMEVVDTIRNYYDRTKSGEGMRWDIGNRAYPYLKTFVDFLVNGIENTNFTGFLEDDDRLRVSSESYYFTPCKSHKDRKLVFYIYKDDRELWKELNKYID